MIVWIDSEVFSASESKVDSPTIMMTVGLFVDDVILDGIALHCCGGNVVE